MPTLEDNDSKIDNSYAEGRGGYSSHPDNDGSFGSNEARKLQGLEQNLHNSDDLKQENDNIQNTRNKEAGGSWTTDVTPGSTQSGIAGGGLGGRAARFFSTKKGKGATGGVVAGLITALFFTMSAPAFLLVNMAEVLKDRLINTNATIVDAHTTKVLRYKMQDNLTSGSCKVVTIRCKYKTLSETQLERFRSVEGLEVKTSRTSMTGRYKIDGFEFNGRTITANNLSSEMKSNPAFLNAIKKGYRSTFWAYTGSKAVKVKTKLGLKSGKALGTNSSPEEMKKSLLDNQSGEAAALEAEGIAKNDDGTYTDGNGNNISEEEAKKKLDGNKAFQDTIGQKKALLETGKSAKSATKGALKGAIPAIGLADSGCTGWTVVRTASFAAKYLGALQMIRYANTFLSTADSIKAGDATPEEVEYLGNIITSQNSAGKSGMESRGWNYAMYGDVSPIPQLGDGEVNNLNDEQAENEELKSEVTNYINGQITSSSFMAKMANYSGKGGIGTTILDNGCGLVKSKVGQGVLIGAGVAIVAGCIAGAIFTLGVLGGACSGSAVAQAGFAVTISLTVAYLSPWLISLATDSIITGEENGNEAINAVVSGGGALDGQLGMAVGGGLMEKSQIEAWNQQRQETLQETIALKKSETSPFDINSPYSFVGSLGLNLHKYINTSSISNVVMSPVKLSGSIGSIFSPTNIYATDYGDADVCEDPEYKEYATDINCNPIVGQTKETQEIPIDEIMDFMEGNGHIDDDGSPMSDKFEKFLEYCPDRTSALFSYQEGEGTGDVEQGRVCSEGYKGSDAKTYQYFRAFLSTDSAHLAGEEELPDTSDTQEGAFNVMTYNIGGLASNVDNKKSAEAVAQIAEERNLDIIGLQEATSSQLDIIDNKLGEKYGRRTEATRSIYFKKDIFKFIEKDVICGPKKAGSISCNKMLWVKLESKETSKQLYVASIHPDVDDASNRLTTAKNTVKALGNKTEPVIILGDMNEAHNSKNVSKYFTDNEFDLAYSKAKEKINKNCDSANNGDGQDCKKDKNASARIIDHIYISSNSDATVNIWENIKDNSSDHNPILVNVSIPGFGNTGQLSGDVSFPVDKKFWTADKSGFLRSHGGAGTFTPPNTNNVSVDIGGVGAGQSVYAIAGGTVIKRPLGRSSKTVCSNGAVANPGTNHNGGLMIESKIQGGTLLIAYAHGNNVTSKETVSAGDQIMKVGNVGNSCGAHLHIDMSFDNKNICPQDVFIALGKGETPDFKALVAKGSAPCGR